VFGMSFRLRRVNSILPGRFRDPVEEQHRH
jgi:hypothetical protein